MPKKDNHLRIQAVSSQDSQSGPKYQYKGEVSGPEEIHVKGQKQKTGVKVKELPEKTQIKKEVREKKDKRKNTEKDVDNEKETYKGQSKIGDGEKDKGKKMKQRVNMEGKGDDEEE